MSLKGSENTCEFILWRGKNVVEASFELFGESGSEVNRGRHTGASFGGLTHWENASNPRILASESDGRELAF
jgi:hypothetical protein